MEPGTYEEGNRLRRHAERSSKRGELELRLHPADKVVRAELMGASQTGFRIRFCGCAPLKVGSRVRVTYPWGKIYADVVWCHSVGDCMEAGFILVEEDCD